VVALLDAFGNAIDRKAPLSALDSRSIHASPPALIQRCTKSGIFETGIKIIDVLQ
jgi:F-type H+/Na+-transporting ATPase subunit beta